jgi:hypothetical protein
MTRALAWLVLLPALIAKGAAADCGIAGRVVGDGLPLAGVEVVEMRVGVAPHTLAVTGADGGFSAAIEPLPADLLVLKVILRKPPFDETTLLFPKDKSSGCPSPARRDFSLERPAAASGAGEALPAPQSLCGRPSVQGLTIYLAPYQIYNTPDNGLASTLNGDLPNIVHHRILAFQSRLGEVRAEDDVSVEMTCPVQAASGEELRRVGAALNALAVIAGEGELSEVQGGPAVVNLESVFRALPTWQNLGGRLLQISDTIPAARLLPSRIAEQLNDLWGKEAVLAVALHRLAEPHQQEDEQRVHQLLIELRKTMTQNDPLLPDVQSLLARLEQEDGR